MKIHHPLDTIKKINVNFKWLLIATIKELTSKLSFNCRFDKHNGLCQNKNKIDNPPKDLNDVYYRCCCANCYNQRGYLSSLPKNESFIKYYEKLFDKETGFWRKDNGCILPRSFRSNTCILYHCGFDRRIDNQIINIIRKLLSENIIDVVETAFIGYILNRFNSIKTGINDTKYINERLHEILLIENKVITAEGLLNTNFIEYVEDFVISFIKNGDIAYEYLSMFKFMKPKYKIIVDERLVPSLCVDK